MIKTIGPKFRRAMHFDCHTCPGVQNAFSGFDAEEFAQKISDAHVEYINFTARCNMGFSYYNTKVGKKYEGLGERDLLQERIFDILLPDRLIKTVGMPQSTVVSVTQNEEYKVLHVKATHPDIRYGKGVVEEHSFMRSAEVSLAGEYEIIALPEMDNIETKYIDGRTVFMTGDILGYKAFLIK